MSCSRAYASARACSRLATATTSNRSDARAAAITGRLIRAVERMPHRTAKAAFITLSRMEMQHLARGLWRWTAPHPDWEPDPKQDGPDDWPELVGSVAYDRDGTLVLVDPLVPAGGWRALDRLAKGKIVHVLTTLAFHRRSREAVRERYGAETSNAKAKLPDGVETVEIRNAGERMVWIPEHGALVPGD